MVRCKIRERHIDFMSHSGNHRDPRSGDGTNDRFFRAFDASSGEQLWQMRTNSGVTGVPTSFSVNGKQYIAVQSGWGVDAQRMQGGIDRVRRQRTDVPQGGVIWVFALPE